MTVYRSGANRPHGRSLHWVAGLLCGDGAKGSEQVRSGDALEKTGVDEGSGRGREGRRFKRIVGRMHGDEHEAAGGFAGAGDESAGRAESEKSLVEENHVGRVKLEQTKELAARRWGGDEIHVCLVVEDDAPGHAVELGGHGEQDADGRGAEGGSGFAGFPWR
jgi:hypothetical protein